jgi:hypothetical protein
MIPIGELTDKIVASLSFDLTFCTRSEALIEAQKLADKWQKILYIRDAGGRWLLSTQPRTYYNSTETVIRPVG